MSDNYWWGLGPVEGAPATWGARAIDDGETFGLLGDRQSFDGEKEHREALRTVLNDMGVLKLAQEEFCRLKDSLKIRGDQDNLVTLYEDWFVKVEGNTNASHGYFYVRAYIKPGGYTVKRVPEWDPEGMPEGTAVWSCDELPEVGEVIYSQTCWAAEDGLLTVLGYAVAADHLHVVCSVNNPVGQWGKQQADSIERDGKVAWVNVMGREWRRPDGAVRSITDGEE